MSDQFSAETRDDSERSPQVEHIKKGIERTQADLAGTVAELQRRLSFSHVLATVREGAQERLHALADSGREAATSTASAVDAAMARARLRLRSSPTPLVLLGSGLAAALWHSARRR